MNKRVVAVLVAVAALCATGCCALSVMVAASRDVWQLFLPSHAGSAVALDWHRASASTSSRLRVGERPQVTVVGKVGDVRVSAGTTGVVGLTAEVRARGRSEEEAAALLSATTVEAVGSDDGVTITVETPASSDSGGTVEVDLTITVPTGSSLGVTSLVGDVSARGTGGEAEMRTGVGNLEWVGGLPPLGKVTMATSVGDIRFEVPAGSLFHLDAATEIGSVTLGDLPPGLETSDVGATGSTVAGDFGVDPLVEVELRCDVGDIDLVVR